MVEKLDGVKTFVDDILVIGKGKSMDEANRNHDENLMGLMEKLRENNVKINKEKVKFKMNEVAYIGHVLTNEGVKPDPKKTEAIIKMPMPQNVKELKSFLGMVNYLAKFIPHLSTLSEPLRALERK